MSDDGELTRHDHVLMGLVFSLQTAAMQQLGKLQDPLTGEVTRDLEQAHATIDILEMLKAKCRTATPPDLLRLVDQTVLNLQLNYMDELKRPAPGVDSATATATPVDAAPDTAADVAESESGTDA
jgi:hypothetical protein